MRLKHVAGTAVLALAFMSRTADAAYMFNVDYVLAVAGFSAHVTGNIVTDVAVGSLTVDDIVSYSIASNGFAADRFSYTGNSLSIVNNSLIWTFARNNDLLRFGDNDGPIAYYSNFFSGGASHAKVSNTTSLIRTYSFGETFTVGTFAGETAPVMSPVPLPASAPMFGAALLGLAGLAYAARRKVATVAA